MLSPCLVTFSLSLFNNSNQNLTYTDFEQNEYYVQYVFTNINTGNTITSNKLDLDDSSSWTYTINNSGYYNVSVNIYNQNNKQISSLIEVGNIYQILSQYVVINWAEQNIKYQESGTLQINNGTCYYSKAKYQWQISTNNGKTWNNLEKGSGQISSSPSSLVFSDITYKVQKETNNALYRLEIINDNNSNEVLYSNSLSPNDNLVSANITFSNNLYNLETKNNQTYGALLSSQDNNIDLVVSLSQFGKNTNNEELLKELSGNITLTTQYFNNQINLTNLWQYYNKQTNQIIIPISTSTLITFENNSYSYDYNATNSQYMPISLSLTINQNQSEITGRLSKF